MKKLPVIIALAVCTLILASCNLNDNNTTGPQQGFFSVVNVSPDAPALTMLVNNSVFAPATGLKYGTYIPYYSANAGSYDFSFVDSASHVVNEKTVTLEPNAAYTYFLVDSFSKIKSSFVKDVFPAPASDSVYIRFFNFCPNSQPLTLYDATTDSSFYTLRGFNDPSYTSFDRIKAGIFNFQLKQPDGTVLASRTDTLTGGHVYSIFAKGFQGGSGTQELGVGQMLNY